MRPAAGLLILLGAAAAAAPATAAVTSYPGPGWSFASPETTITVRNVPAEALGGLRVTGSRTGRHSGELHALRLARGAVFTPAEPFAAGERVTVAAPVPITLDGRRRFAFTTARHAGPSKPSARAAEQARDPRDPPAPACTPRAQRLRTVPDLAMEPMCTRGRLAPGHGQLLLSPQGRPPRRGRPLGRRHPLGARAATSSAGTQEPRGGRRPGLRRLGRRPHQERVSPPSTSRDCPVT